MKQRIAVSAGLLIAIVILGVLYWPTRRAKSTEAPLRVGISPYQDLAMLTTYKHLGLDSKYHVRLDIVTLPWEDIIPSLASAGPTVDVGFGSLIEFLTKYQNLNSDTSDPLVFVYPAYVFKGGGFVSFNRAVPDLDEHIPPTQQELENFFRFRIGAQKDSMFDMILFSLAEQGRIPRSSVHIIDTTMADALLAAEAGSLDVAAAGLTQRNEALERGGRIVLTMDKFGFADITGIIARRSTLEARRADIENLMRIWFDCVDFVYSDLDKNSAIPLQYLGRTASTQYTVQTYKRALEAEYLPRSIDEANSAMVRDSGKFSIAKISDTVANYLVQMHIATQRPPTPVPISIKP
jgi:ABC-type nitrate/sulfonate/bicarbonate transport system substrate-binding protein